MGAVDQASGFAARLRHDTAASHEAAENAGFATRLATGDIDRDGYGSFLVQLEAIYHALERPAPVLRDDPVAGPFLFGELERAGAIAADLQALWSGSRPAWVTVLPATAAYCARITAVAETWPAGYVGHHYLRYLGDLSGGQVIGRALSRSGDPQLQAATRFFTFDGIPKPKPFKDAYRDLLDRMPLGAQDQDDVIAEVNDAFTLNGAVFNAVEAALASRDGAEAQLA